MEVTEARAAAGRVPPMPGRQRSGVLVPERQTGTVRRCYLHVGLPKTGTSFLQDVLWSNQGPLAEQGLVLLPARRVDHFHLALAVRGLIREYDDPRASTVLERLGAEARAVGAQRVLISQEALAPTTPEEAAPLLALLSDFEVHVVVTARDLARQLPSAWQQRIQARATYTYAEFLDDVVARAPVADDLWRNQDLGRVLANWGAVLPPERLHVVTSPHSRGSGSESLLDRFCSVLGVDPGALDVAQATSNRSLGHAQADLLRRVNLALGDRLPSPRQGYGPLAKEYLAQQVLQRQDGAVLRVPDELRPWCESTAQEWIQQIREAGLDVVGDEADLRPADGSFGTVTQPEPAEVLDVAARALADVLELRQPEQRELRGLRQRVERQQARIAELELELAVPGPRRVARAARRRLRVRHRLSQLRRRLPGRGGRGEPRG